MQRLETPIFETTTSFIDDSGHSVPVSTSAAGTLAVAGSVGVSVTSVNNDLDVIDFKVQLACSGNGSSYLGGNLLSESNVYLEFLNGANEVKCSLQGPEIKNAIKDEKFLRINDVISNCPQMADGVYSLRLRSDRIGNLMSTIRPLEGFAAIALPTVKYQKAAQKLELSPANQNIFVFYGGDRTERVKNTSINGAVVYTSRNTLNPVSYNYTYEKECEVLASPLIIQLQRPGVKSAAFNLTAPSKGVLFDILGYNSNPTPYAQKKISWVTPETAVGNFFIVLPDRTGQVAGIDQMFGDNTLGPDGQFAKNGYEALAKYDRNRDQFIDDKDVVFRYLRLWSDLNADGVAQQNEMATLGALRVKRIDLRYDPNFKEVDRYGNQIALKSVAETSDGQLHLIYDIWFRITD